MIRVVQALDFASVSQNKYNLRDCLRFRSRKRWHYQRRCCDEQQGARKNSNRRSKRSRERTALEALILKGWKNVATFKLLPKDYAQETSKHETPANEFYLWRRQCLSVGATWHDFMRITILNFFRRKLLKCTLEYSLYILVSLQTNIESFTIRHLYIHARPATIYTVKFNQEFVYSLVKCLLLCLVFLLLLFVFLYSATFLA